VGSLGMCPECGHELWPGAKFCAECGARLPGESARETRKTVTAVFADVVGSTSLQESIDVESAHHVMGRFYATMRDALQAHGGHVAKFIGDAVVGLFGFPTVGEDDALRAVRAAAAMRDALGVLNEDLNRDWGVRIGMRIGVNTGEVVISPEGLAVGDAMNTAARLEQAAPAGQVLIGEATWRQVRHAVRGEPLEPLTLKGKREPVAAFRLLDAPASAPARVRIGAPLIGRDTELARLVESFEHTVEARACRLVSLIGSPGLGKTRLAEELARTLGERATVVWGRCEPTGEGITFTPLVEVLRGAAGIGEADPEPVVRAKLAALVPHDPDVKLLVERAGSILGFGAPAPAAETFWAVRRLLDGLAQTRPLLVVLDDVHWGQPTFWELIEHLAEWARHAPILLLALARPELRELRPALAEPDRLARDVIELAPLDVEHSRRLVDELLERAEVPPPLAARILDTTEGNPLFVGEMVRMLVDDGVLRRQADGWVASADAGLVEVPPTISALLAARIERLNGAERAVVEPAAVIGKQFYRGAVAELAPPPVAAGIDEHLAALQRKEVVEPENTLWIDEPVFRFHHVLIRDAAYRGLLKEARAQLHERFADWLQTKVGELVGEHEEIIGFHLEQAHDYRRQLGPLDQHGHALAARAAARLHSAGRRALAREDLPAASNLLDRAARLLGSDTPEVGQVLVELLEALLSAGETAAAFPVLERLRGVAGSDKRLSAWAGVFDAQLTQLTDTAHLRHSLDELSAAADALAAAGDDRGVAKAHHVRAEALALLGRVGEAETLLDQALAAARRAGETRRVNAVLAGAPWAALWGPSPVMRASGRCLDVVRILRMNQGNRHVEAIALRCQAVLEAMRGRADAARDILTRCQAALEELGLAMELVETKLYAGVVELIAGDDRAAEPPLRAAYQGFAARQLDVGAAPAAALLARALLNQGRDAEADQLTRFAEEHAGEHLQPTIAWCGLRAQVLARRGEHSRAERYGRRAVELASATDKLVDHAEARFALAQVLRSAGREEEAADQARQATRLYQAKGHEAGAARATAFAGEPSSKPRGEVSLLAGLPGGPRAVLGGQLDAAFNRRDWEGIRANLTENIHSLDHRPTSPRGDAFSAQAVCDALRAYTQAAPDIEMRSVQLIDAGSLGLAQVVFTGHEVDSGSAFAIPVLVVAHLEGQRYDHMENFNPEDLPVALERLLELQPDPATRGAWRQQLDIVAAVNAPDVDALTRGFGPGVEVIDHRQKAPVDYPGLLDLLRGHPQLHLELLDTAGDAAVMSRMHLIGAGGEPVLVLGQVTVLRGGVAMRVELFEPDDETGMRARFEALSAPQGSRAIAKHYARLVEAFNGRDWPGMASVFSDDFVLVDKRPVTGWPTLRGPAEVVAMWRDMLTMWPDIQHYFELVEGDDETAILYYGGGGHVIQDFGGGEFDNLSGSVAIARDGLCCYIEVFDSHALEPMRARRQELRPLARRRTGTSLPLEPLAAEHSALRLTDAAQAGDWVTVTELLEPSLVVHSHRAGTPIRGRDGLLARLRELADTRCRYVVWAATDTASAGILTSGGSTLGVVMSWRAGRCNRLELFEPADETAMRASFEQLAEPRTILATPPRGRSKQVAAPPRHADPDRE